LPPKTALCTAGPPTCTYDRFVCHRVANVSDPVCTPSDSNATGTYPTSQACEEVCIPAGWIPARQKGKTSTGDAVIIAFPVDRFPAL
jgi:hypothetical protein